MSKVCMPLFLVGLVWMASPGRSQDKIDLASTALALAPSDAAFFSTSVNMRAAWQDFSNGNFVNRMRAVPFVQVLEAEFERQWNNPQGELAQAKAVFESPNVRNLVDLAGDMFDDEVFSYGGDDWCETIEGLMDFQNRMTSAISQDPEAILQFFGELERESVDRIRIPTTVIGFRLSSDENARLQLDALEGILRLGVGQIEQLKPLLNKLRRNDLRDGQTLTLTLDTSLIPLDQLEDEQREIADKVIELLEGRSFSFAMGVKSNTLLLAFGESDTAIDEVGEFGESLLDHASLDVLKKADLSDLRAISFASKHWRESQWKANFSNYFSRQSLQFSAAIDSQAENIPDVQQWKQDIRDDARWLDDRLSDVAPEFGDMLAWSRATASGAEGWTYDWSENAALENAAPLKILQHAGTGSLLMIGLRQREMPVVNELVEFALDQAPDHLRRFISVAEQDAENRDKALAVLDRAWPLVEESYEILRDQIGPALSSNQSLFAFATQWTVSEIPGLPPLAEPLPLPEFAVACSLDNRKQFLDGCDRLYKVFDSVLEIVRGFNPDAVPADYSVPRPREQRTDRATSYYYAEISDAVPLPGFKPQLLVSDDVIVLGYSERQVLDMVEAKPLATRPGWMTEDMPVAAVSYVDCAGMVSAIRPWVKYGLSFTGQPMDAPLFPQPGPGPIPSGNDILQIWDCLTSLGKMAGTATVKDGQPTVSRWVWVSQ